MKDIMDKENNNLYEKPIKNFEDKIFHKMNIFLK